MAFVGLPMVPMLLMAAVLGGSAFVMSRRDRRREASSRASGAQQGPERPSRSRSSRRWPSTRSSWRSATPWCAGRSVAGRRPAGPHLDDPPPARLGDGHRHAAGADPRQHAAPAQRLPPQDPRQRGGQRPGLPRAVHGHGRRHRQRAAPRPAHPRTRLRTRRGLDRRRAEAARRVPLLHPSSTPPASWPRTSPKSSPATPPSCSPARTCRILSIPCARARRPWSRS